MCEQVAHRVQPIEPEAGQRIDLVAGTEAQLERVVELGQGPLQHTRRGEQPPRPRSTFRQEAPELGAGVLVERPRSRRERIEPFEQRVTRLMPLAQSGRRERDAERLRRQRIARDRDATPAVDRHQRVRRATRRGGTRARRLARMRRRRALSSGGVPTVVASTTRISAPYTSWPKTPSRSPSVAKINPTSPRGIMPMPTSNRSPGLPNSPAAAASLPSTAITRSTAAMPSTFQSAMAWMSASIPICRKKTGTSRCPIGARSLRMRSAGAGTGRARGRRRTHR